MHVCRSYKKMQSLPVIIVLAAGSEKRVSVEAVLLIAGFINPA